MRYHQYWTHKNLHFNILKYVLAFTFYFISMTTIFILTCISFIRQIFVRLNIFFQDYNYLLKRYIKATKSVIMKKITRTDLIVSTILSALLSLVITVIIIFADIFPTHISMISCSNKMISFTPVTILFKVALSIIVFFLPVTILIFTNARVLCFVSKNSGFD